MVIFYQNNHSVIYAVGSRVHLAKKDLEKLAWLFSELQFCSGTMSKVISSARARK